MNDLGLIDPHLQAIVQAAENGANIHRVVVVCGSTLYIGIPTSTSHFANANIAAFASELAKDVGGWKTSRQEKETLATERAEQLLAPITPEQNLSTEHVLSLCPAQVFPPGLTSYEVPAVRIHLQQVDSWWVAPFLDHQAKFRGGGVGVSF
jgi:hypothetical protein